METIFIVASIVQGVAISLGVGTSTVAIVNFFAAIADGVIDKSERHMMGFVYFILRMAMVVILLTVLVTFTGEYVATGTVLLSTGTAAIIILVSVLYINAILMTMRVMPSTIGPALQASTWYTLGIIASLTSLGLVTFSVLHFVLGYVSMIFLAIALVNGAMAVMKSRREAPPSTPNTAGTPSANNT